MSSHRPSDADQSIDTPQHSNDPDDTVAVASEPSVPFG